MTSTASSNALAAIRGMDSARTKTPADVKAPPVAVNEQQPVAGRHAIFSQPRNFLRLMQSERKPAFEISHS